MSLIANAKIRLREFKPTWAFYNLPRYRKLRGNAAHYKSLGIRKNVVRSISHRDVAAPSGEIPWLDRPDAREALARQPELSSFSEEVQDALPGWIDDGYAILRGWLDGETVRAMNAEVESLLEQGEIGYHYRGKRIMDSYKQARLVSEAVRNPELMRLLSFILGRDITLFQTINFFEGSQQRPHSDTFHMTTEPLGYLIAIWVALEDITAESGPVVYYPGSHKLPYIMGEDFDQESGGSLFLDPNRGGMYEDKVAEVVEQAGIEPKEFVAKAGDVLIWHANLIHGGRPVTRPGATRKSLVAHYFAQGVLCYHESTERPALINA